MSQEFREVKHEGRLGTAPHYGEFLGQVTHLAERDGRIYALVQWTHRNDGTEVLDGERQSMGCLFAYSDLTRADDDERDL